MGKGGLIGLGAAALTALAACSTPPPATPRAPDQPVAADPGAPAQGAARDDGLPVGSRLPPPDADACGAQDLQWLVGQPRTAIPVPVNVVSRRVACTTCPVTEDYSPYRLNIFYDQTTGIIEQVRCG